MDTQRGRASWRGQLTLRGVAIGSIGCVIITASSAYTALKLGALPWPIVFAAVISLFFLKLLGNASLNEANVTHTIMSAGAMVAGGLAFTIPGAWMLGLGAQFGWVEIFLVALAGTVLGLVCTAIIHRHFIVDNELEFPTGTAAAETLRAAEAGGKTGVQLFSSMGVAALWATLRDALGVMPAMLLQLPIPGVAFGIYNSPMMLSVGFLVGMVPLLFWFGGAVFANFGLIWGGSAAGIWSVDVARGIVSSLGMGLMMGSGLATVAKDILPKVGGIVRGLRDSAGADGDGAAQVSIVTGSLKTDAGLFALAAAVVAVLVGFVLGLGPVPAVIVVLLTFVTTIMSAQSCGQTGIDPMEIFGLIVLLVVAALGQSTQVQLFFVAGIVAVACGLAGDVMNDFKAGHMLGTDARAQWLGQALGGVLGALVAAGVMVALVSAYGPDAFGPGKAFVSAQASVVATMVSGIPSVPAFVIGIVAGIALYWAKLPAMLVGLGVYLPFYLSFSSFLGALVKFCYDKVQAGRRAGLSESERAEKAERDENAGLVVASGVLGGESIAGVVIALVSLCTGLMG